MSESDNLPAGGTDTAQPLSLDEAANLDWNDPEADNDPGDGDQQSETGEHEAEASQETATAEDDQIEAEAEGTADEADSPEPADDVTVSVNGQKVPLSDLKSGYMRQQDYSRKTQEVANTRRDLEAMSARVSTTVETIADYLVRQIPEAPHPSLAMTDPGRFVQMKAMHETAVAQVNALLEQAGEVKAVTGHLTDQQKRELLQQENAKLAEAFPHTSTEEGRRKFFEAASSAARELGYSDEEIATATDHRMFKLAHYAMLGLRAEQSRAKATQKVVNKPPVASPRRPQGATSQQSARSKEAMKRLARTGSIHDALAVDFD